MQSQSDTTAGLAAAALRDETAKPVFMTFEAFQQVVLAELRKLMAEGDLDLASRAHLERPARSREGWMRYLAELVIERQDNPRRFATILEAGARVRQAEAIVRKLEETPPPPPAKTQEAPMPETLPGAPIPPAPAEPKGEVMDVQKARAAMGLDQLPKRFDDRDNPILPEGESVDLEFDEG